MLAGMKQGTEAIKYLKISIIGRQDATQESNNVKNIHHHTHDRYQRQHTPAPSIMPKI